MNPFRGELYLVTCKVNGKMYVGKSIEGAETRWKGHVKAALDGHRNKRDYNSKFHRAIRKHGPHNFTVQTLPCDARNHRELLLAEKEAIARLGTAHWRHYNSTFGGEGGVPTAETRRKLSAIQRQRGALPETRARLSAMTKELWSDPKRLARRLRAQKKTFQRPEVRKRYSDAAKKRWKNPEYRAKNSHREYDYDQFAEVYARTGDIHEVIKVTGASFQFVRHILKQRGIWKPVNRRRARKYDYDQFVDIFKRVGKIREVCNVTGADRKTVSKILERRGLWKAKAPKSPASLAI